MPQMIRVTVSERAPADRPKRTRRFARIASAKNPRWIRLSPDEQADIVRGLVLTESNAHQATLSYDHKQARACLQVRLDMTDRAHDDRLETLFRMQGTARFTRIHPDPHSPVLIIEAVSTCYLGKFADRLLEALVNDLCSVLDDPRLSAALGSA